MQLIVAIHEQLNRRDWVHSHHNVNLGKLHLLLEGRDIDPVRVTVELVHSAWLHARQNLPNVHVGNQFARGGAQANVVTTDDHAV